MKALLTLLIAKQHQDCQENISSVDINSVQIMEIRSGLEGEAETPHFCSLKRAAYTSTTAVIMQTHAAT